MVKNNDPEGMQAPGGIGFPHRCGLQALGAGRLGLTSGDGVGAGLLHGKGRSRRRRKRPWKDRRPGAMLGGKVPDPPKDDTEAAGSSDKLHIWFGYQTILGGPKGVDIGQ